MFKNLSITLPKTSRKITFEDVRTRIAGLSARAWWLIAVWLLFAVLVLFKIHGSSVVSVPDDYGYQVPGGIPYLFRPFDQFGENVLGLDDDSTDYLLAEVSQPIRSDEWYKSTPMALSQAAHDPPYPVVNTNIGLGQNMLITSFQTQPVWHITALARPATWGYLLLGVERGLAWQWWFPIAGCFTVLLLLFEIIFKGRTNLSAFGALWFCGSAYVVAWSNWPAQTVMWAALIGLTAYWLAAAADRRLLLLNAILMGIGIPGFAMMLYPAWQVPLVYLFAFLFVGLVLREKLYLGWRKTWLVRLGFLGGAAVLAGLLLAAWLFSSWDAFKAVANTVYPGNRISNGGDYLFTDFFKGNYNFLSLYSAPYNPANQSESASFYMFYPAVFAALIFSNRLKRAWGWVGWTLTVYMLFMLEFQIFGLPDFLAKLTLLSYTLSTRVDIGMGLASIMLTLYLHTRIQEVELAATRRRASVIVWLTVISTGFLFLWHGFADNTLFQGWPSFQVVVLVTGLAGLLIYFLLTKQSRAFCGLLGFIVAATTIFFNPLSVGLSYIYNSELAQHIKMIADKDENPKPMWLQYGSEYPLVSVMGGRTINETMWYPQYNLWNELDPGLKNDFTYNRHIRLDLEYTNDDEITFENPGPSRLMLTISPTNPVLQKVGAKYVLGIGEDQHDLDQAFLDVLYRSPSGNFTIYQIPSNPNNVGVATAGANLQGNLDVLSCDSIAGWVWDQNQPDTPLKVELYDGDKLVTSVLARIFRDDLQQVQGGNGQHAFDFDIPDSLQDNKPHQLTLKVAGSQFVITGKTITNSTLTCGPN